MKTKKMSKKLVLSKETVSNLGDGQLNRARGGVTAVECETDEPATYCWGCPSLICPDSSPENPGCILLTLATGYCCTGEQRTWEPCYG